MNDRILTSSDVADILGFTSGTIQNWAQQGKLPYFKIGGKLRFWESQILGWVEAQIEAQRVGPGTGGEVSPTPTALPVRGLVFQASPAPHGGGSYAS